MVDQNAADTPQYDWQNASLRKFELGDVFGRAFRALKSSFPALAAIAAVLVFVPNLLFSLLPGLALVESGAVDVSSIGAAFLGVGALFMVLMLITIFVGAVLAPAAMTVLLLNRFNGTPMGAMESVRLGLSRFWVLLGASILAGLGILAGTLLLIVPGIILYCGWFVVMPVVVMERRGVTDSIGRSWELTRGYRWWILVVVIGTAIISGIISGLFTAPFPDAMAFDPSGEVTYATRGQVIGLSIASGVAAVLATMISSALIASTYRELRVVKEGADSSQIADIFS